MKRSQSPRTRSASPPHRPNLLALLIGAAAVGVLYVNFDPPRAGAGGARVDSPAPSAPPPPMAITVSDSDDAGSASPERAPQETNCIHGRAALALQVLILEKGIERLSRVPSYTATLHKQERIDHVLGERQTVEMKIRHEPFSVYMKWLTFDPGRELLYVEGENAGNMIVHAGGWKARLVPALSLDPRGSMAMRESRYPVTMAGLLAAARKMVEFRRADLSAGKLPVRCTMHFGQVFENRPCWCFVIESNDPNDHAGFRKTIAHIDEELCLPICIRNYAWPIGDEEQALTGEQLDEATLVEFYTYTNVNLDTRLAEIDFDRSNEGYRFRR